MTQTSKNIFSALIAVLLLSGCGAVDTQIKDLPIEQMDELEETYVGRKAWTRALLVDIGGDNGVIDRDVEVEIVSLDMHWNGAVGVRGPNRKIVRHGMDLRRPLTKESFEEVLNKLFWFKEPDYRYRMNLRKYGKRTARAIRENELFKGMEREAALESWGYPDEMKSSDIGGADQEQWIYMDPR
ncbi:MAG TPA: hypothetical protein VLA34_00120, partial [Candidatus Krumholzibacterium sp.]|nr:hypothetical protein [Candidatus Krumholzibacterium sp.]